MHKDAKIGIATTLFIGLIGMLVWNSRKNSELNEVAFDKNKKSISQLPNGQSIASVEKWLTKNKLNYRIHVKADRDSFNNSIILNSRVPFNIIESYISGSSDSDKCHGYQFLFDKKGNLLKSWAENYCS